MEEMHLYHVNFTDDEHSLRRPSSLESLRANGGDSGGVDTGREGAPRGGVRSRADGDEASVPAVNAAHVTGGSGGSGSRAQGGAQVRLSTR